jgi:hypothetical protein
MNPKDQIRLIDRVGGVNGESLCMAGDYLEQLNATIARQAQGFLTVAEAAQSLEDTEPGVVAKEMIGEMLNAFHVNELDIRNPGDKMRTRAKGTVRDFIHLVKICDVNEWLEKIQCVSYRLNVAAPAQTTATLAPAPEEPANDDAAPRPAVPNWKMLIQAEATAYCLRLRKAGANPTKNSILEPMVNWCRDNNVKTDGGIYPSDGYLRTHVLGGKHWDVPN